MAWPGYRVDPPLDIWGPGGKEIRVIFSKFFFENSPQQGENTGPKKTRAEIARAKTKSQGRRRMTWFFYLGG